MTPDAAFGHDRRGTPETVAAIAARDGFDLVVVPPFGVGERSVRSSDIRAAIARGDLAVAERLLGRPYAVVGNAAVDPATGACAVAFEPPFALPPEGARPATVRAWPATDSTPSGGAVEVTIRGGTIQIAGSPPAGTVEIIFRNLRPPDRRPSDKSSPRRGLESLQSEIIRASHEPPHPTSSRSRISIPAGGDRIRRSVGRVRTPGPRGAGGRDPGPRHSLIRDVPVRSDLPA